MNPHRAPPPRSAHPAGARGRRGGCWGSPGWKHGAEEVARRQQRRRQLSTTLRSSLRSRAHLAERAGEERSLYRRGSTCLVDGFTTATSQPTQPMIADSRVARHPQRARAAAAEALGVPRLHVVELPRLSCDRCAAVSATAVVAVDAAGESTKTPPRPAPPPIWPAQDDGRRQHVRGPRSNSPERSAPASGGRAEPLPDRAGTAGQPTLSPPIWPYVVCRRRRHLMAVDGPPDASVDVEGRDTRYLLSLSVRVRDPPYWGDKRHGLLLAF